MTVIIDGTKGTSTPGLYSNSTFTDTYVDGVVVDYTTGTGRITVGGSDGFAIRNGGPSSPVNLLTQANSGYTTALQGATSGVGTGISFPATQLASSDANTLDDYEEGTWTPTVAFGGASVGLTMSSAVGRYTKVGRVVLIQCYLAIQNKGSSTGNMTIGGLPFPNNSFAAAYASSPVWGNTLTSISGQLQAYLPVSNQNLNIGMSNTGTQSFLTQANVSTGSDFMLDFSYIVD